MDNTTKGSGFILHIMKIMAHLHTAYLAMLVEWPISQKTMAAEMEEVNEHLNLLEIPQQFLTSTTENTIITWREEVRKLTSRIIKKAEEVEDKEELSTYGKNQYKASVEEAWKIGTLLDIELAGYPSRISDPGTAP